MTIQQTSQSNVIDFYPFYSKAKIKEIAKFKANLSNLSGYIFDFLNNPNLHNDLKDESINVMDFVVFYNTFNLVWEKYNRANQLQENLEDALLLLFQVYSTKEKIRPFLKLINYDKPL